MESVALLSESLSGERRNASGKKGNPLRLRNAPSLESDLADEAISPTQIIFETIS